MSRHDVVQLLYIVAFSLFITGLHMLRGPRTAVRGNQIAAIGMAVAVIATLLTRGVGDWILIVVGVAIGTAIGIPSARSVKMTQMPQMVALFNGVGGGAVALISIVEFRATGGDLELQSLIPILFAAIIGSISFWGSIVAFLKLQESLKGRFAIPKAVNGVLAAIAQWGVERARKTAPPGAERRCDSETKFRDVRGRSVLYTLAGYHDGGRCIVARTAGPGAGMYSRQSTPCM